MLKQTLFTLSALTSLCVAQSPLVTLTGGTNQGNVGGGIYFDLQINSTVTITQISTLCGANTVAGAGTMTVFLGPPTYVNNVTNPALWTAVSTANATVAPSTITAFPMNTPFALGPGNYGVALQSAGYNWGYTNGNGNATPGSGTNQTFSNAQMTFRGGAAQNAFLTGGIFAPRIFNGEIHYTLGGTPIAVASWAPIGKGCYDRSTSFYEYWPSGAFVDFGTVAAGGSGITSMRMNFLGNRYLVQPGTNTVVTPTSPNLMLGDDVNQPITLDPLGSPILYVSSTGPTVANAVSMCSNGFVNLDGTTGAALIPNPTNFLSNAAMFGNWKDFDPSTVGSTHYEWDATLGAHIFTWNAVPDFGIAGTSNTFQILFYTSSDVEFRWGAMSQSGGGAWPVVMGFTPGANARNDGGSDMSVRLGGPTGTGFLSGDIDNAPLSLSLTQRPLLGSTPGFATTSMEPGQGAGFLFIGFVGTPAGASLAGFNIPECLGYVDFFQSISTLWIGSGTAVVNFPIANSPAFNGVQIFAQSSAFGSSFNASFGVGINASNGVQMTLGNL